MYKHQSRLGKNNIAGRNIRKYRKSLLNNISIREFAEILQSNGLHVDKNTVQRMEVGERYISDIEIIIIAKSLGVTICDLLEGDENYPLITKKASPT